MARNKIALVGAGQIGAGGVERIVEIQLNAEERAGFDKSVSAVKVLMDVVKGLPAT